MSVLSLPRFKVLVVDDTVAGRMLKELYVERSFKTAFPVFTECTGRREAAEALKSDTFHLALIDCSLSTRAYDTRGAELVSAIRAHPTHGTMAIVGMCVNALHEEPMLSAGADEFMHHGATAGEAGGEDAWQVFAQKATDALIKAADRDPRAYLLLLHRMNVIEVPGYTS